MTQPIPEAKSASAMFRHELRTPLNAIIGYSQMLEEEAEGDSETVEIAALQEITAAGHDLLALVNGALDADSEPNRSGADRDDIALQVGGDMKPLLDLVQERCAELLALSPAPRPGFATEVGKIAGAAGALRGMLQRIGQIVARADAAPAPEGEPDTAPGKQPFPVDKPETPSSTAQVVGRILVTDDNEINRDLLFQRLTRQGHQVTLAEDGHRALELVGAHEFDLVLLDIVMPGLDGYQVLLQLKTDSLLRHIPVIMISALDEIDSVVRCIEIGAEDYLPKPFNPVLLQARIGACLEKKSLRDQEVRLYRQLEENFARLQQLEALRDSLTDMVVHDLRTPLTSLIAGLGLIKMVGSLNEQQHQCLEISSRGGQTLLQMINDLLDISKMEDGSLQLQHNEIEVPELVAEACQQVSDLILTENQTLTPDVPDNLPPFRADREKLLRVLVNLLGNAVKFTPRAGSIDVRVRATTPPDELLFTVTDTGEGIPSEAFERIFDKFGQVETRSSGRKLSTGLGLTFCKMVVQAHRGRIWVESEMGKGSTFFFTIPLSST